MKWVLIFLALATLSPRVWGQWVLFDACGFKQPEQGSPVWMQERTKPAPTLGPFLVWANSVGAVMGMSEKVALRKGETACTALYIQGVRLVVIGSLEEVEQKLRKTKCVKP